MKTWKLVQGNSYPPELLVKEKYYIRFHCCKGVFYSSWSFSRAHLQFLSRSSILKCELLKFNILCLSSSPLFLFSFSLRVGRNTFGHICSHKRLLIHNICLVSCNFPTFDDNYNGWYVLAWPLKLHLSCFTYLWKQHLFSYCLDNIHSSTTTTFKYHYYCT